MKTIFLSIVLVMFVGVAFSQVPVGYRFDVNGIPFNGYYDAMTYAPEKQLTERHLSDSYEVGYYYDKAGTRVSGHIKFEGKKIFFKQENEEFRDKIKPDEVKTFVIGIDSFFTVSKYYRNNVLHSDPTYVQFIAAFDDYVFAKHYYFSGTITETYLVKSKDSDVWENFSDKKTFKEKALKYFDHIPYLEQKIKSGKYKSDQMLAIIKMAEYLRKYEQNKEIGYDQYWQETRIEKNIAYRARIVAKEDSIWTFDYYAGATRLYQAKYSAFYPSMKNGELTCYYPGGGVRQIILYKNDKIKDVKTFTTAGVLNRHYEVIETKKKKKEEIDYKYIVVNDAAGKNILEAGAKSTITVHDEVSGYTYTSVFRGDKMISTYRLENSDTIFQIVDPQENFSVKALNRNFETYMQSKKYEEALAVNAQGKALISILLDPNGYTIKGTLLNQIHPEIDKAVNDFISKRLLKDGMLQVNVDQYKKDKSSRYCEIVLPIDFSALRFYRHPVNYYQSSYMFMHQQMMQMPAVSPPSFH